MHFPEGGPASWGDPCPPAPPPFGRGKEARQLQGLLPAAPHPRKSQGGVRDQNRHPAQTGLPESPPSLCVGGGAWARRADKGGGPAKSPQVASFRCWATSDQSSLNPCASVSSAVQKEWNRYPRAAGRVALNEVTPVTPSGSGPFGEQQILMECELASQQLRERALDYTQGLGQDTHFP